MRALFLFGLSLFFVVTSCQDDLDDKLLPLDLQSRDFIWKGMNLYYLWQGQVPDLADTRFQTQTQLNQYIQGFASPEALFDNLLFEKGTTDRFSVIFNDYTVLEQILSGSSATTGMDYGLRFKQGSTTDIFGWVRYVMPNTDAASKGVQRGMIFHAVNGTPLTASNYVNLLSQNSFTINLADFDGGNITPNGQSIALSRAPYNENPVLVSSVIPQGDKKIGYLMYNGFFTNFETQLNQVFANFLSQGVTHLVVDLRYNSGGSVATCTRLASMITGQFTGQIFASQQWNQKVMDFYASQNNSDALINRFTTSLGSGAAISSLQLNQVIVLTTPSSASASELLINGLKPYINVVQIGGVTSGKNVGSVTLYDSPNFTKNNVNPSHKYAMQPLVLKIVNKDGFGDYANGISPSASNILVENLGNLGVLGSPSEPFLNAALQYIQTNGRPVAGKKVELFAPLSDSKKILPFGAEMYVETPDLGGLR
jgi:carboxyl-terminal processing protease